jgi:site-specific DNA-methyltransferase (adenine-specific)
VADWTLHLGDCLDVLRAIPDKSVDHVITDPPYEAEAHTKQRRVRRGPGDRNAKVEPLSFQPIADTMRADIAAEFGRLAKRWALAFCQAEAVAAWRDAMEAGGMSWRRSCVWIKPDGMPQLTGDRPGMGYESIACAHAPCRSKWNGGGRVGVFAAMKNRGARTGTDWGDGGHPTIKPLDLMLELVDLFTDPGETILDPFAGSGTTGVACLRLGRKFIWCELDPKYHALATERLRAEEQGLTLQAARAGQVPLFGGGK